MDSAGKGAFKLYSSYCHSVTVAWNRRVTGIHDSLSTDHANVAMCVCIYIYIYVCVCVCVCVKTKGRLIRFSGGWTLMTAERSIPAGTDMEQLHYTDGKNLSLSLSVSCSSLHSYSHQYTHTPPPFSSLSVFGNSLENATKQYPLDLVN